MSDHFGLYQVGSGQLSGHLVLSHFGFQVVSGLIGSVIWSSNISLSQVSGHIKSGRVVIKSSNVVSFRVLSRIRGSGGGTKVFEPKNWFKTL
jgi:hypothetical protein